MKVNITFKDSFHTKYMIYRRKLNEIPEIMFELNFKFLFIDLWLKQSVTHKSFTSCTSHKF